MWWPARQTASCVTHDREIAVMKTRRECHHMVDEKKLRVGEAAALLLPEAIDCAVEDDRVTVKIYVRPLLDAGLRLSVVHLTLDYITEPLVCYETVDGELPLNADVKLLRGMFGLSTPADACKALYADNARGLSSPEQVARALNELVIDDGLYDQTRFKAGDWWDHQSDETDRLAPADRIPLDQSLVPALPALDLVLSPIVLRDSDYLVEFVPQRGE